MAVAGETIANPQTGERITFRRTAADTGGHVLEPEFHVTPGGGPAAAHLHPKQQERFDIHAGTLELTIADEERSLGGGETVTVPPGVRHIWHAAGDDELHATLTFEPALTAERFFEALFALANAGKTKSDGSLRLLDAAVLLDGTRDFLYVPNPPVAVQKALFRLLAPIGRALGRGRP